MDEYDVRGDSGFRDEVRLAWRDFRAGLALWRLWTTLAWGDIAQRYRGSVLGPFWIVLSTGVLVGAIGFLYGRLFRIDLAHYLPYLAIGLVFWNFMSATVTEACTAFLGSAGLILQGQMPFSVHVLRTVLRNVIILAHMFLVCLVVLLAFGTPVTPSTALAIPGLAINIMALYCLTLSIGALCARFRDIAQLVQSLLLGLFFVSPIIWRIETLGGPLEYFYLNPVFALIELVRAPLLGQPPPAIAWIVAAAALAVAGSIAALVFVRARRRLTFWVLG